MAAQALIATVKVDLSIWAEIAADFSIWVVYKLAMKASKGRKKSH